MNFGRKIACGVLLLCLSASVAAQVRFSNQKLNNGGESALRENVGKLINASAMIYQLYVDSVDSKKMVEDAINGILSKLDPHSAYTNAVETKRFTEPLEGSFEGIGVQFNMLEDTLIVIQPVPKGPSEKVGILAGDRIISVADTAIAGVKMSREEIMRRLRGPKGSVAHLGVLRSGIKDTLKFDVVRDKIPVNSVDAAYMVTPTIGLIRFNNFAQTTHDEVVMAIDRLKEKGMKDLILDLQQNGGGYLQAAADIASEFLQKGDLIVYTRGRSVPDQEFRSTGGGAFTEGKIIVLVDDYSASASEILAGAIQDQDRGIVVGRRTFGKGLVQRPLEMPDGSMIRLTVARYYTPSGRCIQKPYEKGKQREYALDIINRYNKGELTNADSIHFPDSLRYQTLRKQRTVYGGGGIMPDYFVALDSTRFSKQYRQLSAKNLIVNTSLKYMDKHRKKLTKSYPTFEKFQKNFQVPQDVIDGILAEGEKQEIKAKDEAEKSKTIENIQLIMKGLIARDLWDMSEYYAVIYADDEVVHKAVELMESNNEQ
ncbi:MAG: S41 family peptidase [Bacteroidaceae bacterium]|nr:S41 family peptidase [Bacteroidaceae bacterium]